MYCYFFFNLQLLACPLIYFNSFSIHIKSVLNSLQRGWGLSLSWQRNLCLVWKLNFTSSFISSRSYPRQYEKYEINEFEQHRKFVFTRIRIYSRVQLSPIARERRNTWKSCWDIKICFSLEIRFSLWWK